MRTSQSNKNDENQDEGEPSQNNNQQGQNSDPSSQNENQPSQNLDPSSQNENQPSQNLGQSSQNKEQSSQNENQSSHNNNESNHGKEEPGQNKNQPSQNLDQSSQSSNQSSQSLEQLNEHSERSIQESMNEFKQTIISQVEAHKVLSDFNLKFLVTLRGILYILQLVFSLVVFSLMAGACMMQKWPDIKSDGFNCGTQDIFLFVVGCSSFVTGGVLFLSCLLSKETCEYLFVTHVEVIYSVVYCFLYLVSSISLLSSVSTRSNVSEKKELDYNVTMAGGAFGIFNTVVFILSIGVYFCSTDKLEEEGEEDIANKPVVNIA